MSHHGAKGKDLISGQAPARDSVERGICFGISKDLFLGTAAVVEEDHIFGRFRLIGYDDLIIELEISWLEKVELQGALVLFFGFLADEQEAIKAIP